MAFLLLEPIVTVRPSIPTMQSYTAIVHSSTVTLQPSSTPDFNIGAIAGGVAVGVFVPVVIVIAVLAVVLWIKSRRSTQVYSKDTSNPVYDTNSKLCTACICVLEKMFIFSASAAKTTDTGADTLTSRIYAEPNAANGGQHTITTRPPPLTSSEVQYSEIADESAKTTTHIYAITNDEYFLTSSSMHTATEVGKHSEQFSFSFQYFSKQNHYEFAVYVPTKV